MLAGETLKKAISAYRKHRANKDVKNNSHDFKTNNTALANK